MANGCMNESILGGAFFGTTYTIDIPKEKRAKETFTDKQIFMVIYVQNEIHL